MSESENLGRYSNEKELLSPIQYNLIKTLQEKGPLPRKDLVINLKVPRTTVYDNLIKLQKKKIIEKFSRMTGKKGRPKIYWRIKE